MPPSPIVREPRPMAAFDARDIVTVRDSHGGLTVYFRDRPTRYLLDGEWYRAVPFSGSPAPVPAPDREATPA